MNNEEPSTDYGLSSEIDIIFSEIKENKKLKNVGETSQATSLQFASQIKEDKSHAKDISREDKTESNHGESVDDKLITWAARLELESISLKELVTGNLGHIFKQNYDFLKIACEEMTEKLNKMAYQVEELKKPSSEYDIGEKLIDTVNTLTEKVTTIEKMVKSGNSRERRDSIDTIETVVGDKIEYSLSNNKLIKTMMKSQEKMSNNIDKLYRTLQANTSATKPCADVETTICEALEAHDKATLDKLSFLQEFITENGQGTNLTVTQEITSIKQYLKLLLPRIIGLETNSKKLYHDYHELLNLFNGPIHLDLIQADHITPSNNSSVMTTVSSASKPINEALHSDSYFNQKKRKLI